MSFSTYTVITQADIARGTGFAVSLQKVRGATATLLFSLRPEIAGQCGWADKDRIEVALGEDEHHGLVRLRKSATGTAVLQHRVTGDDKRGGPYFRLSLGRVPLFVNRSEAKKWVLFEQVDDGWVEVVLPAWADETGPKNRTDRPRMSAGLPAIAPPAKPTGKEITARLMGDPDPGRSALAQKRAGGGVAELSRSEARRRAEEREAPGHVANEAAEWNRKALEDNRLADLSTTFGLTKTEAKYLRELIGGKLCTKERLLEIGHDEREEIEIKSVDVYVHKLRKKMATRLVEVETVWGQGYRMSAQSIARVMVLIGSGDEPGREDDEAELAAMEDEQSPEGEAA